MTNPFTWLSRLIHRYEPLIKVEISESAILHNLHEFHRLVPNSQIAPVLKGNAYGHGLTLVAKILENARKEHPENNLVPIPFFVVDSYFEALALRSKGIRTPLLVIGYTRPEIIANSKLRDISYTISGLDMLKEMTKVTTAVSIHAKIDTGMHRQGIMPNEVEEAIAIIRNSKNIKLSGLCSHLSDADNENNDFTEKQILLWNDIVDDFTLHFPTLKYIHLCATYGHLHYCQTKSNVTRLGLGLYGVAKGLDHKVTLKPALEMKTIISGIKNIEANESVGYSNTFKAKKDMRIATIPLGYFEGLDRRLSNIGFVEVSNKKIPCPIVGRVSMNITTIDVSDIPDVSIGTEVTVMSHDPHSKCSIHNIAKLCNDIEYNIAIHIPETLRRVVVR